MKKFFFAFLALVAFSFQLNAQNYVSTAPANRNVILEEFTGRNCGYCPDGHVIANQIAANNPGRFWAINVHAGGFSPTSYPNLNTTDGTVICSQGFNCTSFPGGVVNRATAASIGRGQWTSAANTQLGQQAEVNVAGVYTLNESTRVATITVEVYYTGNSTVSTNYLTVAMLQDSIMGSQSGMSSNPSQIVNGQYCHMHVLRDIVTSTWGEAITPTTQGTLITRTYTYTVPETIGSPNGVAVDLNNIHFLAWVSEQYQGVPTRPILNACEIETDHTGQYHLVLSANPNNGGSLNGAGWYNAGSSVTATATAATGYTFNNWTENGTQVSTNPSYTFNLNSNRTLTANFTQNTYTVTVTANPTNGGTVTGGGSFTQGQSCTVSATAASGYTFTNWTENGTQVSTNANYTFNVSASRNLVANFSQNTYTITTSSNPSNGGTTEGGGQYAYGESCTVVATPNGGSTFDCWKQGTTQVSTDASYTFTVTSNRNLVAYFTAASYTVSVVADPADGGTVTGGGTFNYGQTCAVSASANPGFSFEGWKEDGEIVSTENFYMFQVTHSCTLTASFVSSSCEITAEANPAAGATITGAGTYAMGETVTLTVVPNTDYTFVNWTENGNVVSEEAVYTFTANGNRNLIANLEYYDAVAENGEVALYPNPTNGNITIQAQNMNRITVVSVLGQVVYDAEVEGDSQIIDMAQFNAGVYMVRIATENGVSTQRVTVVK